MDNGFDLKEFLDSQVAEGVVDSEGSFTVAREKALTKLAHFGLPGDYDWVLKIVQAVNIWGAPKLQVRQSRVATSFFFCPPKGQSFPSDTAIVEALNSLVLDREDPVHQLAMALRSLVQQASLSFVLAVRQHGELGKPIFAGDDTSNLGSDARARWTQIDREGVRLTVSHFRGNESLTGRYIPTFSRLVARHALIASMLERRCFTSAVPIDLDGRLVSAIFPTGNYHSDRRYRPLFLGRLAQGEGEQFVVERLDVLPARTPKKRLAICASPETQDKTWFFVSAPELHVVGVVFKLLDHAVAGPVDYSKIQHTVNWVRHGVLVARYAFAPSHGYEQAISLFFPASQMRTDLSGLQIELGRQTPSVALSALQAIRDDLTPRLDSTAMLESLLAEPRIEAPPAAPSKAAGEADLEQVGQTAFTGSIAFDLPSVTTHAMKALDTATELVSGTVFPQHTYERWAAAVQRGLHHLVADLDRSHSLRRSELE